MAVTPDSVSQGIGESLPVIKVVKIPQELHRYREAISYGLFSLASGRVARQGLADAEGMGEEKKLKVVLSPAGAQCLRELIDSGLTIKQAVTLALVWLSEQPPHLLNTRI